MVFYRDFSRNGIVAIIPMMFGSCASWALRPRRRHRRRNRALGPPSPKGTGGKSGTEPVDTGSLDRNRASLGPGNRPFDGTVRNSAELVTNGTLKGSSLP